MHILLALHRLTSYAGTSRPHGESIAAPALTEAVQSKSTVGRVLSAKVPWMPKTPEDIAREQIDAQLVQAGWIVQDPGQINIAAGLGVAIREFPLAKGHGSADYLL